MKVNMSFCRQAAAAKYFLESMNRPTSAEAFTLMNTNLAAGNDPISIGALT